MLDFFSDEVADDPFDLLPKPYAPAEAVATGPP
jgi:hypothetical protein